MELKTLMGQVREKLGRKLEPSEIGMLGVISKKYADKDITAALQAMDRRAKTPVKLMMWFLKQNAATTQDAIDASNIIVNIIDQTNNEFE